MSDPSQGGDDARQADHPESVYSKDYWDNVFEQIGRRPLVKVALAILALLYATAIYAPILANDRPFKLEAIDYKGYGRDLKTIYAASISLRGLVKDGPEAYAEKLERNTEFRRFLTAVQQESDALIKKDGELRELLLTADQEMAAKSELLINLRDSPEANSGLGLFAVADVVGNELEGLVRAEYLDLQAASEAGDTLDGSDLLAAISDELVDLEQRRVVLGNILGEAQSSEPSSNSSSAIAKQTAEVRDLLLAESVQPTDRSVSGGLSSQLSAAVQKHQEHIREAIVVSRLPEAGRNLFSEYGEHAELLNHLEEVGEAGYLVELEEESSYRPYQTAIDGELQAMSGFLDTVRRYLPEDQHAACNDFGEQAEQVRELVLAGQTEQALESAGALKDQAKLLRSDLAAITPEKPDKGNVELIPHVSYPLWKSLTGLEVFFMWLWAFVLTWPLWNAFLNRVVLSSDRIRIRKWRKIKWRLVWVSSLLAAFLWNSQMQPQATFESAPYKSELTSGGLAVAEAEAADFPWLPLGFAESHLDEVFRPPTWHKYASIDEEGYYIDGPRVPKLDPVSNTLPPGRVTEVRFGEPERNASMRHPLGTDSMGRDLTARLLYGGRISLAVGILSTVLLVIIGIVMGALAGYFGGWVDIAISRIIEVVQSFPAFFLILTAVALIPEEKMHPIFAIVFFIAIVRWTGVARLVRGEFLRLKDQDFAMAARALGFSSSRVIFRHVLPNAMGPVLVAAAFSVAAGILTESGISFLGLGIKAPIPSWGSVLNDARGSVEYWWLQVFPGLLIFLTVFCYNIVGEGIRDALDPRRKV